MRNTVTLVLSALLLLFTSNFLLFAKPNRLKKLTDEQKIQIIIAELQAAAQNGLAEVFIKNFSSTYQEGDKKENNNEWLKNKTKDFFTVYKPIPNKPVLYIYDVKQEKRYGEIVVECKIFLNAKDNNSGETFSKLFLEKFIFTKEKGIYKIRETEALGKVLAK